MANGKGTRGGIGYVIALWVERMHPSPTGDGEGIRVRRRGLVHVRGDEWDRNAHNGGSPVVMILV